MASNQDQVFEYQFLTPVNNPFFTIGANNTTTWKQCKNKWSVAD